MSDDRDLYFMDDPDHERDYAAEGDAWRDFVIERDLHEQAEREREARGHA